jgi:hypothetical protein
MLVGKYQGNIPFVRPFCTWDEDIKMYLKNRMSGYGLDSAGFGYSPVAGSREQRNKPSGFIKSVEFLDHSSKY